MNVNYHLIIHCICCTVYVQYCSRPLVFLLSIFSGMPSLGDSYQKTLFVTLERQLVASLDVSERATEPVCEVSNWSSSEPSGT